MKLWLDDIRKEPPGWVRFTFDCFCINLTSSN